MTNKTKHHILWFVLCLCLVVLSYTLYDKLLKSHEEVHEITMNYQSLLSSSEEGKLEKMIIDLQPEIDQLKVIEYKKAILNASQKWEVPPLLIAAMVMRESSFKSDRIGKKLPSGKSCLGPMQVHPVVHKKKLEARGVKAADLQNVNVNIDVGAEILKEYLTRFNGNVRLALMKYVGGKHQGYVDDVINAFVAYS